MRTSVVLVLLALCVLASADKSKFQDKMTALLNMQARAVDAVDSALNLLRDLQQANIDAQAAADEVNRTHETQLGKQIADLTFIADTNKANGDASTEQRKFIESEIQTTQEYLVWINNRRTEIHRKRAELQDQRCYASMMFVKALKEHDEALEVIKFLREEVAEIVNSGEYSFSQLQSSTSKLSAYTHLFNQAAMKEFSQLTEYVDPKTAEWNNAASDNEKGGLELERMTSQKDQRSIGNKFLDAIDKLEKHLEESMQNLKENEIKAAWDLVAWLFDSEAELVHLDEDQAKKTTYIDKLIISIVAAKAHEDQAWEIYFESAATLNDAIADLNAKRAWYAQEKARRDEENTVLDYIIRIFIEKVSSMDSGIRGKVNDVSEDGAFDAGSVIGRRTATTYGNDAGKLAQNVAAEAGF